MTNIEITEMDQSTIDSKLAAFDSAVGDFVKSSRGTPTQDFEKGAIEKLRSAGFIIGSLLPFGDRIALTGISDTYKAKVQLIWDNRGFVDYTRFNGQSYNDSRPVWDISKLKSDAEPRMVKSSRYYMGPLLSSTNATYRKPISFS